MKSWIINLHPIVFIYWDKKARTLEFLFFDKKVYYFWIK